ncbi:winged helix-turn-helix domain-containing protein [Variovorax soli]|uniref:ATPase/DNA-binding winged helix-turn-helix (WHTH) protein n=1 Tax=Variovorax soli TaxID=376815 RepID=A0ABU1NE53_9BURK|nr:winged helix-turn-helix domain-containing protein [Variovorax soli]MDR6536340.1 putative ATPase/DNA-binding winged helix-turn-helix (wHTH) protein [Variovorax soli]
MVGRSNAEKAIDISPARGANASFGPFRLFPAERKVEREGVPLPLSSRALDLLIVLVEHAGETVGHEELTLRVWRGLVVDSGSLRMQITSLRKALRDGEDGVRYIETVRGRGYCFVAPVSPLNSAPPVDSRAASSKSATLSKLALPPAPGRMIGREGAACAIAADLMSHRFLTIVGPGGMGKTTLAVAVAHAMLREFPEAVCFVNLGALSDPAHVASTVASTLGVTIQAEDALPGLKQSLRGARMLLVLDNCEHVISASAALAEQIFREAPQVHILATSREALRVDGEFTYLLPPLECPPPGPGPRADEAQAFPAVQLFMACAAASGSGFELSDENAVVVAGICSRLDGIALAIEFAAGRVGAYGIEGVASLLDSRFGLDWGGRRTALPRQQTLQATLDWSHELLSGSEQAVLRRLAVFVGTFTLEAAQAIAHRKGIDEDEVVIHVGDLIAKSLVSTATAEDGAVRYRLLETTRAYASEKLEASGEMRAVAESHARYFSRLLGSASGGRIELYRGSRALVLNEDLGNVRAALDWCFGDVGLRPRDAALGIDLAVAAAPALLQRLLLTECHKWSAKALSLLGDADRGSRQEMLLQETLAAAAMWTEGGGTDIRAAITRALAIAHQLGETSNRLRLLVGLHIFFVRAGDFRASLAVAEELETAARTSNDLSYRVVADWMLGGSHHFLGDQQAAERDFQEGFGRAGPRNLHLFGLDYHVRALVTYARVLWLAGRPDRAKVIAQDAIGEAAASGRSVDVCFALLYSAPVFLWCGDWSAAETSLAKLKQHSNWQALLSFHTTGLALEGELLVHRGETERGTAILREALRAMKAERHAVLVNRAACALAEGLIRSGELDEALAVIADALAPMQRGEEALELPELLRLRATVLLLMPGQGESQAEDCFMRSLECARRQHASAWQLRTATSLARLRITQGRREEAHELLSGVYRSFNEGFGTPDLEMAERLMIELNHPMGSAP